MIVSTAGTHRRVAVLTPTARIDLAVPAHLAVAELLPVVLELARTPVADGTGWRLGRVGHDAIPPEHSLAGAGVRDGDLLDLRPDPLFTPEPVFDEITDVAAAMAAEGAGAAIRPLRAITLATAGALFAAAVGWAWWYRTAAVVSSAALAVALMAASYAVAHRTRDALTAAVFGVAAVGFAAVAAAGWAPAGPGTWIAAGAAATVTGLVATLGVRTTVAAFTALSALGVIMLGAASANALFGLSLHDISVATVVLAVMALPTVPRAAARLSGLRAGHGTGDDSAMLSGPLLQAAMSAARRTVAVVAGLDAACACAVSVSAVILVDRGDPWSMMLAVVAPAVVSLRARSVDVPSQVIALAAPAVAGLIAVAVLLALRVPAAGRGWLPVGAATVAGIGVWWAGSAAARVWAPSAHRAVRVLESVAVVAVVPLAVAAVGGYALMRHL